jgi:hypothetical protein
VTPDPETLLLIVLLIGIVLADAYLIDRRK